MALKKLVEVDEKFPVLKRPRLGAPPPADDVLDNVGAAELSPTVPSAQAPQQPQPAEAAPVEPENVEAAQHAAPKRRERQTKRVGQGIHKGMGTDARRYRKTGRTLQFGARVRPEFAESVKVTAAAKNKTIGELLDDMYAIYGSLQEISDTKKVSVDVLLMELRK